MVDEGLESAREAGWRELAEIDAAYERGDLDRAGWHDAVRAVIVPAYLAAADVRGGSGHSGTADDWERTRGPLMAAITRAGDFLDVGCANGLLMESVHRWGAARGLAIEPYGVDIAPELADRARRRLPQWADRIWAANAADWVPARRWDYVRTGLEYVPDDAEEGFVAHLLEASVAPGGRLVVGKTNERRGDVPIGDRLRSWGHRVTGELRLPHAHPGLLMTWYWVDA
ncbi:class I SAM-dependent methyltransferase [Nocardioides sp. KR10-350]|uniref:class I SAM-dependent methyltransferase n=1 Tax=Nocardioides cheoyonin TaxID=3156615 RepID=UPI0032B56EB3